ncbi:unnamed protein product [Chilo suppressalis]|uniref:Uncharacterized protein n=1 Tax=Chilo suppressalis TaxID=168631 RepID=A0ABN8BAL3_CHISP|nr:unnamed protein product [Chilo suppressalis]
MERKSWKSRRRTGGIRRKCMKEYMKLKDTVLETAQTNQMCDSHKLSQVRTDPLEKSSLPSNSVVIDVEESSIPSNFVDIDFLRNSEANGSASSEDESDWEHWEHREKLRWPKYNSDSLCKDENAQPGPDWIAMNCTLKRKNFPTYEDAEEELIKMLNKTDTDTDNDQELGQHKTTPDSLGDLGVPEDTKLSQLRVVDVLYHF